jgi:hypothetical protein
MPQLLDFILEKYPNGFTNDELGMRQLRHRYAEKFGKKLPEEQFGRLLSDGIRLENKFFWVPTTEPLAALIDNAMDNGRRIFYYTAFQQKHSKELENINIFSPELMKSVIEENFPYLTCRKDYFFDKHKISINTANPSEKEVWNYLVCYELRRCFTSDNIVQSYTRFTEKTYIPLEEIKKILGSKDDFIWQTEEHYTHLSFVDFGDEETNAENIRSIVQEQIAEHGFANAISPEFLNAIKEITENNPKLSQVAIREAVYQKFLRDDFVISGNNITSESTGRLSGVDILRNFIRGKDEVRFADLSELCDKHLGPARIYYALRIGNDLMVRVNAEKFVAFEKVNFDTSKIDEVLVTFSPEDYIPLKAVKHFHSFPPVENYPWNLYLLESFVRRFSCIFRYDAPSTPNNQSVGVIVRKSSHWTNYKQITNDVITKAGIAKTDKNGIYDFLIANGYICTRSGTWTI